MLNNKLPTQQLSSDSIFDLAKAIDPSNFIKTEKPDYLCVKSLIDMPNNTFIPFGPILTTTSLNFKLYAQSGKPYTLSIPLGNDKAIFERAQALADKYCESHPKDGYISQYHRWNILATKNIKVLKEIINNPDKLAEYTAALDQVKDKFEAKEGWYNIPANADVPENICKARTLGLPYSIISKLASAGIESLDHTISPITLVYTKQAVAGTYITEVSNQENPLTPELLKYILVPSFSMYESIQESDEFKQKVSKLLDMIENGRSPVRWGTSTAAPAETQTSTPTINEAPQEQIIESSGAFI